MMQIAAPPGMALVLEPGGLDAPQTGTGTDGEIAVAEENGQLADEGQQAEDAGSMGSEMADDGDQRGEPNRVIVRRRFSTRSKLLGIIRKDAVGPALGDGGGGRQQQRPKAGPTVRQSYSTIRTGIIRLTPESMKCKLYCRGSKCVYCTPDSWAKERQAIRGVYSNWITENILAMARPTSRTFDEFNFVEQLRSAGIKTILNLQCVNEHDFCGPPLVSHAGFSYDPELLMREKFFYYNFAIPDFGTTSVHSILDIVKVLWFALRYGKVAVHCHAGLGRTGTLIACFLVWSREMFSLDAIELVRAARPNSVQGIDQINTVEEFAFHIHKFGTALPSAHYSSGNGISLRQLMANQRQFLPNEEARHFAHIPKVLFMLGDRLLRQVFEPDGIYYAPPNGHHARSCTFGTVCVNWRNAFTPKGKLQVRTVVNLLARCTAFPYEKDQALVHRFQQLSLVTVDQQLVADMDIGQLVTLLNAFMDSLKKPYCSRRALIEALGNFSPDNPTGPIPESDDEEGEPIHQKYLGKEEEDLVRLLVNPRESEAHRETREREGANGPSAAEEGKGENAIGKRAEEERGEEFEEVEVTAIKEMKKEEIEQQKEDDGEEERQNETEENGTETEEKPNEQQNGESKTDEPKNEETVQSARIGEEIKEGEEGNGQQREETEGDLSSRPESAFQGAVGKHGLTREECARRYGGSSLEGGKRTGDKVAGDGLDGPGPSGSAAAEGRSATGTRPPTNATTAAGRPPSTSTNSAAAFSVRPCSALLVEFGNMAFDNYDSHTNKEASLNADWQCSVFHVCNVLSYLTGENYDAVVDLLAYWFTGESNRDVKQALYCHMRDLFARNMRQQEEQAAEWRRRMGLPASRGQTK